MNEEVIQRRNWFRYFPEGSIEFIAIARVLAIMLLVALLLVGGTQRPIVLLTLVAVLWCDYALTLWWAIQMRTDLTALGGSVQRSPEQWRQQRRRTFLTAVLCSVVVVLLVAPWPEVVLPRAAQRTAVLRILWPLLLVCLPVAWFIGYRALQQIALGRGVRTLLLLIPGVHWFALHRLLKEFQTALRPQAGEIPSTPAGGDLPGAPGSGAFVAADVLLVLAAVGWVLVISASGADGAAARLASVVGYVVGIGFGAIFAIVDVAATESVQRQFIDAIRRV